MIVVAVAAAADAAVVVIVSLSLSLRSISLIGLLYVQATRIFCMIDVDAAVAFCYAVPMA